MNQRGAGVLSVVLILAAILVLAMLALNAVSAMRVKQVRSNWDATLGSWDEIMQRYPAREANASALELERLAARLGIYLTPRSAGALEQTTAKGPVRTAPHVRPTPESVESFDQMKQEVFGHYDTAHYERVQLGTIDAPPPALTSYMEENADALAELKEHLLSGESPLWTSDISRLWAAPIPNLLGQHNLHKLFSSLALTRLHAGDVPGALDHVETSYRLADSLRDSPILINQLILISATRMQVGILRHVPNLPDAWIERMASHDYRRSFLTAMKYEGWVWARSGGDVDEDVTWRRLAGPVVRPYNELCLADLSEAWRERLTRLERVDVLCDRDLAPQGATLADISIPRWNLLGNSIVPNLGGAIHRLARLELDLELTRLVQEAGLARGRDDGSWPLDLVGERPSTHCPDDVWIYSMDDGVLRLEFSRPISWPDQRGVVLPSQALLR